MNMQEVKSSNISKVGYDAAEKIMAIQFSSGAIYHYRNVTPDVHEAMLKADSIGKHFAMNIKGSDKFLFKKYEEPKGETR